MHFTTVMLTEKAFIVNINKAFSSNPLVLFNQTLHLDLPTPATTALKTLQPSFNVHTWYITAGVLCAGLVLETAIKRGCFCYIV